MSLVLNNSEKLLECVLCSSNSPKVFKTGPGSCGLSANSLKYAVSTLETYEVIQTNRLLLAESLCRLLLLRGESIKIQLLDDETCICLPCTSMITQIHDFLFQLDSIRRDLNSIKKRIREQLQNTKEYLTDTDDNDSMVSSCKALRSEIVREFKRSNFTSSASTTAELSPDTPSLVCADEDGFENLEVLVDSRSACDEGSITIFGEDMELQSARIVPVLYRNEADLAEAEVFSLPVSTPQESVTSDAESVIDTNPVEVTKQIESSSTVLLVQLPQRRTRSQSKHKLQSKSKEMEVSLPKIKAPSSRTTTGLPIKGQLCNKDKRTGSARARSQSGVAKKTDNRTRTNIQSLEARSSTEQSTTKEFLKCTVGQCKFKFDKSLPDVEIRLEAHVKRKHEGIKNAYKCPNCPKTFNYRRLQVAHTFIHTGENPYICDVCGRGFRVARYLRFHMRIHTGDRRFPCPTCDFKCLNNQALKVHMLTHTKDKAFMCELCSSSFLRNYDLRNHQKKFHSEELDLTPYKCQFCDKILCGKFSLKWHEKMHTGELDFKCSFQECSFRSSTKQRVLLHEKSHTLERTFKCEQCECSYKHKQHLLVHLRVHTGERPYKCKYKDCDKAFRASSHLSFHQKLHAGELKFICPYCPEAFVLRKYLNRHIDKHRKGKVLPSVPLDEAPAGIAEGSFNEQGEQNTTTSDYNCNWGYS